MQTKTLGLAIAAVLLMNSPANATGLGSPPSGFSWTGFYVGGHGGYAWGDLSGRFDSGGMPTSLNSLDIDGGLGGVQTGYNYQAGWFVIGVEGDYSWVDSSDSLFHPDGNNDFLRTNLDDLASIRARLGVAWDRVLLFGTIGVGFAEYDFSVKEPGASDLTRGKLSFDESGVAVGGGVEVAFLKQLSLRVDYLHYDVGTSKKLREPPIPDADTGDFVRFDDIDVVRVGLNYRFNFGGFHHAAEPAPRPPLK